jgi:single-stranded-DNA-specific exonuclease
MRCFPVWNIRYEGEYTSVVDAFLASRGMGADDLHVDAQALHAPGLLADMDKAVERIERAIRGRERIVVFGDYDVDGLTSTVMLLEFLERVGADAGYLLPDRHAEGYGLLPKVIDLAAAQGARLIVTVDNGISAFEALTVAAARGIDVIVTDHHQQLGALPGAVAVINPNRRDSRYPFAGLAGVGVTFKLVQALCGCLMAAEARRQYLNGLLDLVVLGTVADIASVLGENRLLIQRGLQVLNRTPRPGLRQLLHSAGYADKPVDTAGVAFHLAPRLNVAGRLQTPELAFSLLRSRDEAQAAALAHELSQLNGRRQTLQRAGMAEAEALVSSQGLAGESMILLLGESWHLGVIGLLASKLTDKYARPAVVCTGQRRDGTYTGSARSIPAYDIAAAVSGCSDLLLRYGGHPAAAGFTLLEDCFEPFRVRLLDHARDHLAPDDLEPRLEIDLVLRPEDIAPATCAAVQQLEPFGPGNLRPVFGARSWQVVRAGAMGRQGDHLRVELRHGDRRCSAVWWDRGQLAGRLPAGRRVDAAFALQADAYRGPDSVQMVLQDMYLVD